MKERKKKIWKGKEILERDSIEHHGTKPYPWRRPIGDALRFLLAGSVCAIKREISYLTQERKGGGGGGTYNIK